MTQKRRKKNWSYNAGERGRNWVRAYRQKRDGRYYLEWMDAGKRRSALIKGVSTAEVAKRKADELAAKLATFEPNPESTTLDNVIDRYTKELSEFLHYRTIDVSSVKELVKRWYPGVVPPPKQSSHRALDDIKESIAELRFYRDNAFKVLE